MNSLIVDEWRPCSLARKLDHGAACGRENREFELDHKGKSADCFKYVQECEKHLDNACALLWGCFQLTLSDRIEA